MYDLLNQMGKRIFDRRKQLRMTQEELAEKAQITPQTVSTAELGKKALRPENIIRICTALEISTDYLLMGKVNREDYSNLTDKFQLLSPDQYRYLEDIINSYIAAVSTNSIKDTAKRKSCGKNSPG
ncbi:MAG: helix-turn-helix domain-containing protein [Lachnospiraceae bacterium]|nr:helix-turn-helix domain-containing protein [Lachnospiraceae bacterium]